MKRSKAKKVLSLALSGCMMMGMIGCGAEEKENNAEQPISEAYEEDDKYKKEKTNRQKIMKKQNHFIIMRLQQEFQMRNLMIWTLQKQFRSIRDMM